MKAGVSHDAGLVLSSSEAEAKEAAAASLRRAAWKMMFLAMVAALLVAVTQLTPLGRHLRDLQTLKARLQATGALASLAFAGFTALAVAAGFPRLLCSALGGMMFGFAVGLGLSLAGSLLGAYGTFLFARWAGRDWVVQRFPEGGAIRSLLEKPTVPAVFWARQLPVPGFVVNIALGLTSIRQGAFLVGSALGFLPLATVVAFVGSGLGKESAAVSLAQIGAGGAAALFLALGLYRAARR